MEKKSEKPAILIADDQPFNQKLLSLILEKLGYTSILANDGQEAVEKAELYPVALIFMDIQMPKKNGYEVAEYLRKRGFNKPIIAITASTLSNELEICLKAGIDDVMLKPVSKDDVEKSLLKWMNVDRRVPRSNAQSSATIPVQGPCVVFDAVKLIDTFMGNEKAVLPLLAHFLERTKSQLEALPNLEKAENWDNARRDAHSIKGAALTMSGEELGKAAARLELAYKNIVMDEIKAAYPPLQKAFDRFKEEAEDFIRSKK